MNIKKPKKERRERHDTCGGHWVCLAACWFLSVQRSAVPMEILDFVLLRWAFAEVQVCAADSTRLFLFFQFHDL